MSEHTPTTDEVRADYVDHIFEYVGVPEEQVGADFDRWLNRVQAEAWEAGVKSVNPHLSDDDGTLTFTIGLNPYLEGEGS